MTAARMCALLLVTTLGALGCERADAAQQTKVHEEQVDLEKARDLERIAEDKRKAEDTAKIASAAASAKPVAELHVAASGGTMAFDVTKFTVSAGQKVHVVFENKAPGTLAHNWVLVKPGKEAAYAAVALEQGQDKGYIAATDPDMLAHTDMVVPGKTSEVTFTAPSEPGDYPYICSFPGHYMMMKGVLEVKP